MKNTLYSHIYYKKEKLKMVFFKYIYIYIYKRPLKAYEKK